jgi:YVTN family beta-propeller protein
MHHRHRWLVLLALLLLNAALPPPVAVAGQLPPSSRAVALTPDGSVLLVVNPDSNSLTLVDTATMTVIAELPVGRDPRTVTVAGARAYVANRGSRTVSVVDLDLKETVSEVEVGYRPYGVVADPVRGRVFVAVQGEDRIVGLNATTGEVISSRAVGALPSGLALSPDGGTLYVTHLLSGAVTVLPAEQVRIYLPLVLKGRSGASPGTGNQVSPERASGLAVSIPLFADSNLAQSIVLSPDGSRGYVPHTRSNTGNRELTFDTTVFPLVSLLDTASNQHLLGQQLALATLDPPGVGLPFDAALTPNGAELWVVNAASNDLTVIDLAGRSLVAHIEVGDNPRGIVFSSEGTLAYVNNALAGSVSVVDAASYTVVDEIQVTEIPLPPILLEGKRLFHSSDDPRMARAQWISCNTCHFEGEHDGRTWFFAFAGPRNTTSLLGMVETYPQRWSAEWDEAADTEFVIRQENFGSGLLGGDLYCDLFPPNCIDHAPNQGRSGDLDALALFLDSLQMGRSPGHEADEPLTGAEARGEALYDDDSRLACLDCHPPPLYVDHLAHDVGTATIDEKIGPKYDTPTLRGLYTSAPYLHDGSAATLYEALTRPSAGGEHDVRGILTPAEIQDLIAYLLALPYGE